MNPGLEELGILALFMSKSAWAAKVREWFPRGPTPEGPQWTAEQLDRAWDALHASRGGNGNA